MAGIGLELRKLTSGDTFLGGLRAHLYAGILSSGAWIISISILIAIYFYIDHYQGRTLYAIQFLVAVTYLISTSLILSAIFQHSLNRYIADRLFENKKDLICPNFFSSTLMLLILSSLIGFGLVTLFLSDQPMSIQLLMLSSFVVLNLVWLFSNALSGLKNYRFIFFSFLLSYILIFLLAVNLYQYQLVGLLFAFYVGHTVLLGSFFVFVINFYPPKRLFRADIFHFMRINPQLVYSGIFFYLAIWVDKFCFWINESTSMAILGSLRASPIYDMPIFIAFILIIPGMVMFFYGMETEFSRYYHHYYDAIRDGATLQELNAKLNELVNRARACLLSTMKIQAAVSAFAIILAPEILHLFSLAPIYVYLLRIVIVATSLLIILIAQINLLYYLNMSQKVLYITILFFILNLGFTCLSLYLGPLFYGYGFALALLICIAISMLSLILTFKKLTFYSFMLN